eukprot:CAMPEP_0119376938 /NCGR_PEP_ID=MMETSP1334-20130426/42236_1 /TAXON_ID=127549 /ORGANISM="Calcidiscus leptoporus, Strain RCC1130" /LENGTH=171 /DNA_ID=CAMNT_0007395673 /DNA_START=206 /DNA_END=720 /DNA_ORIENTATION=-
MSLSHRQVPHNWASSAATAPLGDQPGGGRRPPLPASRNCSSATVVVVTLPPSEVLTLRALSFAPTHGPLTQSPSLRLNIAPCALQESSASSTGGEPDWPALVWAEAFKDGNRSIVTFSQHEEVEQPWRAVLRFHSNGMIHCGGRPGVSQALLERIGKQPHARTQEARMADG